MQHSAQLMERMIDLVNARTLSLKAATNITINWVNANMLSIYDLDAISPQTLKRNDITALIRWTQARFTDHCQPCLHRNLSIVLVDTEHFD